MIAYIWSYVNISTYPLQRPYNVQFLLICAMEQIGQNKLQQIKCNCAQIVSKQLCLLLIAIV